VAVFAAELVHGENNFIEVTADGPFSLDESLGIDIRGEVVICDLAELFGVFSGGVGDAAVNSLLAVNGFVGVLGLEERHVLELVGRDVLVDVAEALLGDSIPVAAGFLDVVEVGGFGDGGVGVPQDLVLDIHDVLGGVGNSDEINST
jgi:hypothetical protein